jgi:hypothetical protein
MRTIADELMLLGTDALTDKFDEIVRVLRTDARHRPGLRLHLGDDAVVLEAHERPSHASV